MTPQNEDNRVTSGELQRLIERLERGLSEFRSENKSEMRRLSQDVQQAIRELGETRSRVAVVEGEVEDLRDNATRSGAALKQIDDKVNDTVRNAAFISGGIAGLGFLLKLWPFKH